MADKKPELVFGTFFGFYGNVAVAQRWIDKKGGVFDNHKHYFDHVTILSQGSMLVETDGHEPKEFHAPTYIIIAKEKAHKFTALEDNTVFFCIFALREDEAGVEELYQSGNSPYGNCPDDYWDKAAILEKNTTIPEDKNGNI